MGKITSYQISITTQTKQEHPDMTSRMTMICGNSWRITIGLLKRPVNFYFLVFCSIIYQNLLHRWGLYCSKQLETTFHQFCEKQLHITFKAFATVCNAVCVMKVIITCVTQITCRKPSYNYYRNLNNKQVTVYLTYKHLITRFKTLINKSSNVITIKVTLVLTVAI